MKEELPIFTLWYGVVGTVIERASRFPRSIRPTLGARIIDRALDVQRHVIALRYTGARKELFRAASLDLDELRILLRHAFERRLLSTAQYAELAEAIDASGRMLGGWERATKETSP